MKSEATTWRRFPDMVQRQNVVSWMLVLAAFTLAIVFSNRAVENIPNDLRRTPVLLLNALAASVVALGFAVHERSLKRWTDAQFCLQFGIWIAAVFRLIPPIMNEDVLYLRNCFTVDAPYVVLGACVHGGLAVLIASPFAMRVLGRTGWRDKAAIELCTSAVLILFVVTCAVRLLSEHWW